MKIFDWRKKLRSNLKQSQKPTSSSTDHDLRNRRLVSFKEEINSRNNSALLRFSKDSKVTNKIDSRVSVVFYKHGKFFRHFKRHLFH